MLKKTIFLMLATALSGCSNAVLDDGYQVGDGLLIATDSLHKLDSAVTVYCQTAPGDPARNAALAAIRGKYPLIPENGICTFLTPALMPAPKP
jgi:hypothetical protein